MMLNYKDVNKFYQNKSGKTVFNHIEKSFTKTPYENFEKKVRN